MQISKVPQVEVTEIASLVAVTYVGVLTLLLCFLVLRCIDCIVFSIIQGQCRCLHIPYTFLNHSYISRLSVRKFMHMHCPHSLLLFLLQTELLLNAYSFIIIQCKDICTDIQDSLLRDVKELNEQSKAYQYSCLNTSDTYLKLIKAREKALKATGKRKEKREDQEKEVCTIIG